MITIERIRTVTKDGWDAKRDGLVIAHDCSKPALVRYCNAIGELKVGEQFRVIRPQYPEEDAIDEIRTLTKHMLSVVH